MADRKCILTEENIHQIIRDYKIESPDFGYYKYMDSQGYSAFEITRETIKNASKEELYALYDLARSIRAISIEIEYPDFSPINQDLQ